MVWYRRSLGYLLFNTIVRLAGSRKGGGRERGDNESVPSLPRQRSGKGEGTKLNNAARGTVKEPVIELHSDNRLSRDASFSPPLSLSLSLYFRSETRVVKRVSSNYSRTHITPKSCAFFVSVIYLIQILGLNHLLYVALLHFHFFIREISREGKREGREDGEKISSGLLLITPSIPKHEVVRRRLARSNSYKFAVVLVPGRIARL